MIHCQRMKYTVAWTALDQTLMIAPAWCWWLYRTGRRHNRDALELEHKDSSTGRVDR